MGAAGIIIITVILVLVLGHKKTIDTSTPNKTPAATTNDSTATKPSQTTVANTAVTIQNFSFNAKTITIKKGTAVTWTNKDSATHTVTFSDPALKSASSGNLAQGDTYSHTFDAVGSFDYMCAIHTSMTGTVVVTD